VTKVCLIIYADQEKAAFKNASERPNREKLFSSTLGENLRGLSLLMMPVHGKKRQKHKPWFKDF
jgi:hypothetical protein